VRALLAAAAALLVLLTAVAPHAHESALGRHACVACVAAGGEEAVCTSPDVTPRRLAVATVTQSAPEPPVTGAPLGAIPGQSPPAA